MVPKQLNTYIKVSDNPPPCFTVIDFAGIVIHPCVTVSGQSFILEFGTLYLAQKPSTECAIPPLTIKVIFFFFVLVPHVVIN